MQGQKTGGRQKGTPNRNTAEMKEILQDISLNYFDSGKFTEDLENVDPVTRLNVHTRIFSMLVPKEKDVNLTMSEKRPLGGAMGELSRMTMAQQIETRPDLFQMVLDKAKAKKEAKDAENLP